MRSFRKHHEIVCFREEEWTERGEITLDDAAKIIGVCNMTALRMLRRGTITGRPVCPGAPWAIKSADLAGLSKKKLLAPPLAANPDQQTLAFQ